VPSSAAGDPLDSTDASIWEEVPAEVPRRLLLAALDAFAERGYYAATTRDIAKRSSLSPAAVYVHYGSKGELLSTIAVLAHQAVLREVEDALSAPGEPCERVSSFVEAFARWHARNHKLARVVQYEMRALDPAEYKSVVLVRRRFEELLQAEIEAASDADDVRMMTRAVLSLCIDIARWYDPERDVPPSELAAAYADLALRIVKAGDSGMIAGTYQRESQ
jgi:AcrR family transcriptional regulator